MEAGIVDNRHTEIDLSVTVTTMLTGTLRLYRFAERNPAIQIRRRRIPMTRWCSAISAALSRSMARSRSTSPVRSTPRPHGEDISILSAAKWIYPCRNRAMEGRWIIAPQIDRSRTHPLAHSRQAGRRDRHDAARRGRSRGHRAVGNGGAAYLTLGHCHNPAIRAARPDPADKTPPTFHARGKPRRSSGCCAT